MVKSAYKYVSKNWQMFVFMIQLYA
jgi:hypothetical protein